MISRRGGDAKEVGFRWEGWFKSWSEEGDSNAGDDGMWMRDAAGKG